MSITRETLALLWATSFGTCAFPGCGQELVCVKTNDVIGHVCHIVARKPAGPRGDPSYTAEQLDHFSNLLLLCPTHHAIVDRDTDTYTVEALKDMKALHYADRKQALQEGQPWSVNVSQLYYLNIPRLAALPNKNGSLLNMDIMGSHRCLHDMGYELGYILQQYKEILNRLEICAAPLGPSFDGLKPGQVISFDDKFRTKNVPGPDECRQSSYSLTGDLDRDPILYLKRGGKKLVLTLDPRWMTTTTSFVNFRMGWVDLAGLAVVKASGGETVIATPYMLGTPKNEFWDQFTSLLT